jgi:hypothetical protein
VEFEARATPVQRREAPVGTWLLNANAAIHSRVAKIVGVSATASAAYRFVKRSRGGDPEFLVYASGVSEVERHDGEHRGEVIFDRTVVSADDPVRSVPRWLACRRDERRGGLTES